MLNIAVRAARRAGAIINRAALGGDVLVVKAKQANDFVTQVDRAAERRAIDDGAGAARSAHRDVQHGMHIRVPDTGYEMRGRVFYGLCQRSGSFCAGRAIPATSGPRRAR